MKSAEHATARLTAVPCAITFAAYGMHFKAIGPTATAAVAAETFVCNLRPAAVARLHTAITKKRGVPMTDKERRILRSVNIELVRNGASLEAL